jgi:hypothetical protein
LPAQKIKKRNQNKKNNLSKNPPYQKKINPRFTAFVSLAARLAKQKTMRSTTKLGTKNKPISFKIDFEIFFAKTKIDRPPFISPPPYTDKKKEKKRILIKKKF